MARTSAPPATVSINVKLGQTPPIGVSDTYAIAENSTLTGQNVLTNDIDISGNAMTAQLVNGPTNSSAFTFNNDGTFTYTPATNFVGVDSFSYRAYDPSGTFSEVTTVTILVNAVNQPTAAADDNYATFANQTLSVSAPGVLVNDTDTNPNATLTAILASQPSHGVVTLNADGSFTYTPVANYTGPDSFTYVATDGVNTSASATVSINVLSIPPVAVDDSFNLNEATPTTPSSITIAATDLELNDIIASTGATTLTILNNPVHGTLVSNGVGGYVYTPNTNFTGTDSFTYYLTTAGMVNSNPATVTLNVSAVNEPLVASDDFYATHANQTLTISAPGVLVNDSDSNANAVLKSVLASQPSHGVVILNADGSFTYTPTHNYVGSDSFTYKAFDGLVSSSAVTVTINVLPAAPTVVDDSYSLNERTAAGDPGFAIPAPGLLLNDTIPQNGVVGVNVVNSPLHGSLTANADGSFTYTAVVNYFGTDSFTYYVSDGGLNSNLAKVTLNIVAHYLPVAVSENYSVNENTTLNVSAAGVLGNDTNIEGGQLQASLVDGPKHGTIVLNSDGSFSYSPDKNFSGVDSFTYKAVNSNLLLDSTPVTDSITVNYVNVQPIANNDTYTIEQDSKLVVSAPGVLGNDVDPDGPQPLTAVLVNTTQNGSLTLNADGSFTYLPNPQFSGTDSFTYKAFDGDKYSSVATVSIKVQYESPTTVTLDQNSDTGVSNTDHITRDNTPTYTGTTRPNLTVDLYVMPSGSASMMQVGTTQADSTGHFSLSTSVLPDGGYQVFAQAFRADGTSTGLVYAGPLVIDTVAPIVVGSMISPKSGQIYVTFQDNVSGMSQPSLNTTGNYSFYKIYRSTPRAYAIAHASALPSVLPNAPQTVALDSVLGRRLPHGRYLFAALSGGVADVAGNALNGAFYGTFPTGTGQPGSNFVAQFNNDGYHVSGAVPATQFVPIIANSASSTNYLSPSAGNGLANLEGNNTLTNGNHPVGPMANLWAARHRNRH